MMDEGITSFKLYMTYDTQVDDKTLFEILQRLKETGGITGVHCENSGMIAALQEEAKAAGAAVVSTGRSDYPNQVNNVLVFPGLFRGVLDARASRVTGGMKIAAAHAIADMIPENELNTDNILPLAFDANVKTAVAEAVKKAAVQDGVNRVEVQ